MLKKLILNRHLGSADAEEEEEDAGELMSADLGQAPAALPADYRAHLEDNFSGFEQDAAAASVSGRRAAEILFVV